MSSNLRPTVVFFQSLPSIAPCQRPRTKPTSLRHLPIHSNAVTLTYTLQDGNIVFDTSIPITGSTGRVGTETATLFHSFNFFSRSANINISLPYSIGHFQADVNGEPIKLYRSGLNSTTIRLSANLFGAPAMTPAEYMKWHQKLIVGASLTVSTATGQYDPALLINIGNNRWAIKPEVGLSRRWNKWFLDAYAAVWFFTPNNDFYRNKPGPPDPTAKPRANGLCRRPTWSTTQSRASGSPSTATTGTEVRPASTVSPLPPPFRQTHASEPPPPFLLASISPSNSVTAPAAYTTFGETFNPSPPPGNTPGWAAQNNPRKFASVSGPSISDKDAYRKMR